MPPPASNQTAGPMPRLTLKRPFGATNLFGMDVVEGKGYRCCTQPFFFIKNHPKWNVRFGAKTVRYGEKTCAVYEVFNSQCGSYKYESEIPWISFEFLLVVDRNHALCILNSQNLNSLKVHGKNLKSHGSFESFVWCFKTHLKLHMYVLVIGFFVSRTIWES